MQNLIKQEIRIAVLTVCGPTKNQRDFLTQLKQEYTGCQGDFEKDLDELFRSLMETADRAGFGCADLIRYYATITHAKQLFNAFVAHYSSCVN